MPIGIKSRSYKTQSRGSTTLDALQACIGERITVITEIYFDEICIPTDDEHIYYAPTPERCGRVYTNDLVMFENGSFLANAQVGDEFLIHTDAGAFDGVTVTLLEILDAGLGRFDYDFGSTEDNDGGESGLYFANVTALRSLLYQFGISTGDFVSLTDGSEQKFGYDDDDSLEDVTPAKDLVAVGDKDWQVDTGVIVLGLGDGTGPAGTQKVIRITHDTIVTPLYLVGQYESMLAGIAPDYMKPGNSIGYISQIDWNKTNAALLDQKRLITDLTGKFGWYGRRYDGQNSDYSVTSLTIKRMSDSEMVNQLEYSDMEVKFKVNSTAGTFTSTDSSIIFGFHYLPEDPAYYQNTGRSIVKNFAFDSLRFFPTNVDEDGEHEGDADQVIKFVRAEVLSVNQIEVTARIEFGSEIEDTLRQGDTAQYAMWVIVENTAVDPVISDKSALLVQVDVVNEELITVDLLDAETLFIEHPYDMVANGVAEIEAFPVDDIVANSAFSIDYTGIEDTNVKLRACTPKLILKHATEADITLDQFRINLDNFGTVGTSPAVQDIDFQEKRQYKIEDGIRKSVAFLNDYDADNAGPSYIKHFVLSFPFMNRWEYWIKIAELKNIPASLFDPTKPFGGGNHFWNRLANSSGWTLSYDVEFEIEQNGQLFSQVFNYEITSTDFNSNTDWTNCSIKSYDKDTNDEIIVGPKKYVDLSKDTLIVASFDKTTGDVPLTADDVAIVIWAESFEGAGVSEITRISSSYDVTDVSLLKSVDTSNRVKVTKTGNTFTGEALLRSDKIQNFSKLTLYARIYVVEDIDDEARVTNDLILRFTNDDQTRLVLA